MKFHNQNDYFCGMQKMSDKIQTKLNNRYNPNELKNIKYMLLEEVTGFSRAQLLANRAYQLTETQIKNADNALEKLQLNVPIQYVIGKADFFGLTFKVNNNVLIPRPETEELVEWILNDVKKNAEFSILDIGTGSGCIAISLKKNLDVADISGMDISENALDVATQNATLNGVNVEFFAADITKKLTLHRKWDILVSNPPYIPNNQSTNMDKVVTESEPPTALFVPDNDPLLFYKSILEFSKQHLSETGSIYVEIHQSYARQYQDLFNQYGFEIEIRKDMSGNDRMIKAYKKR